MKVCMSNLLIFGIFCVKAILYTHTRTHFNIFTEDVIYFSEGTFELERYQTHNFQSPQKNIYPFLRNWLKMLTLLFFYIYSVLDKKLELGTNSIMICM